MKDIKAIIVKATLRGHGVVQFDGKDQGYAVNRSKNTLIKNTHDNVSYAKASFATSKDAEGSDVITRTLKISGDGLRHAIHAEEHPFHTPNIAHSDLHKVIFLSNLGTQQRGYLITDTGERKKSTYCITSAKEVSGAVPVLELHSRSGAKETAESEGSAKDTTLFSRDSVGDTEYEFTMYIDPSEMGMISLSDLQDRRALVDCLVPAFRERLSANLGSAVPEPAYFVKPGSAYQIPEMGILLTQEQVHMMVMDLLRKVASVYISKSQTGYAKITGVQIKAIVDPLTDLDDGTGFVVVKQEGRPFDAGLASSYLESFVQSYTECDQERSRQELKDFDDEVKVAKKLAADSRKEKKEANKKGPKKGAVTVAAEAVDTAAEEE